MPVRDFDDKGRFVVQLYIINDGGKLPAELFSQQDDPDLFIGNGFLKRILQLNPFMDNDALHTCQSHPCIGVNIVAD